MPDPQSTLRAPWRPAPRLLSTFALIATWLLFFGRHLVDTSRVPYERDLTELYIPARMYLHTMLKQGHLPEWFPYELIGVPFLGQIVTATFHPQTLLFLPFTALTALKLNILGAYLFGSAGAYRFARAAGGSRPGAVVAGTAFAFSGYALSVHNNPPYLLGLMTRAWVGWAAVRLARRERPRDVAILAVCWALVFLGGDVQGTGFAAVLVATALLACRGSRRAWGLAALAASVALLLCSIELLPATVVFRDTFRMSTSASGPAARVWSMHPWRLAELFLPHFIPRDEQSRVAAVVLGSENGGLWSASLFAGAISLALAAMGLARNRRSGAFGALAGIAVWLALGARGELLPLAFRMLPFLARFAYPEKYLALFCVALVPLTAFGFDRASQEPLRMAAGFLVVTVSAAMWVDWVHGTFPDANGPLDIALSAAWSKSGHLTFGWAAVAMGTALLAIVDRRAMLALVAVSVAELWVGNSELVPMASRRVFEGPNAAADSVRLQGTRGASVARVISLPDVAPDDPGLMTRDPDEWISKNARWLTPDVAALWGIGSIGIAYLPALPERMLRIATPEPTPWSHWLGACSQVRSDGSVTLQRCFPSPFFARTIAVNNAKEASRRLEASLPQGSVVWEGGPSLSKASAESTVEVASPGHIVLGVDASAATALVLTEGLSPGWSATIDGAPTAIYPVNLVAMGVALPAGQHRVVFSYATPHLVLGGLLSLLGLACVTGLALRSSFALTSFKTR
jgi:hypothetical protein